MIVSHNQDQNQETIYHKYLEDLQKQDELGATMLIKYLNANGEININEDDDIFPFELVAGWFD